MGVWETIKVREANTPPEMALQVALRAYEQSLRGGAGQNAAFQAVLTALKDIVADPYPYAQYAEHRFTQMLQQTRAGDPSVDSTDAWRDVELSAGSGGMPVIPHSYQPKWGFFHEGAIITAADVSELAEKKRQYIIDSNQKLRHEGWTPHDQEETDAEMLRLLHKYAPEKLPEAPEPGATLDPGAATWRPSRYVIEDAFHFALRYAEQDSPFYQEWNKFVLRNQQFQADRQKYDHLVTILRDLPDEAFKLFDFAARQIKRDRWLWNDFDDDEKIGVIRDSAAVLNELARKNKPWPQINDKNFDFDNLEDWLNEPEHLMILKGVSADGFLPGPGYDPDTDHTEYEFPDGWSIKELSSDRHDLGVEGETMDNCIKDYHSYNWDDKISDGYSRMFSLRDPRNYPHVSMEFVGDGPPLEINQMYGKGNQAPVAKYQEYIDKWFEHLKQKHGRYPYHGGHAYDYEDGPDEEEEYEPEHLDDYDETTENHRGELSISDSGDLEEYYDQLLHQPSQFYMGEEEQHDVNERGDYAYRREYGRKVDAWHLEGAVEEVLTQLAQEPHFNETQMQWGYDMMEAAVLAEEHTERSDNANSDDVDSFLKQLASQIKSSVRPNSPHPGQMEIPSTWHSEQTVDSPGAYGIKVDEHNEPGLNPWGEERDAPTLDEVTAEGAKMALAAIEYYHLIKGINVPVPYYDEDWPGRIDFKAYFQGAAKPLPGMKGTDEKPHNPDQRATDDAGWGHAFPHPDNAYREWRHERDLRESLGAKLEDYGKDGLPEIVQGQHAILADGKHVWMDKRLTDDSGWLAFDQQRRPVRIRDHERVKLLEGDIQPSAVRDFDDEGNPYIVGVTTHPNARRHSIGWTPSGHVHVVGPDSDWAPVYTSQHDPPLWPQVREDMDRSGYTPMTMNQTTGEWERTPLDHLSQQNDEYTLTGQPNIVGTMPHPGNEENPGWNLTVGWTPSGRVFNVAGPPAHGDRFPAAWAPMGMVNDPEDGWHQAILREMQNQGFTGPPPHAEDDERWPYRNAKTKTASTDIRDVSADPATEFYLMVGNEPQMFTVGQYEHMKLALRHEDDWHEERPDAVHVFNAYDGSSLIGSLVFEMYNRPSYETGLESYSGPFMREDEYSDHGFLMSVYIDPNYRGTGIYQQFMAICDQYEVPVYSSFTNDNLRQHMYNQYDPYGEARTANFVVYSKDIREMARNMRDRLLSRPDIAQAIQKQQEDFRGPSELSYDEAAERARASLYSNALMSLLNRYPESFKLWPWAINQMKRAHYVRGQGFADWGDFGHFVDIVGQAGGTIQDLRKHNRLPQGFDVNQMSFDELQDWLYSNREYEDEWENREAVYTFKNGWAMEKIDNQNDLNREGDEMGHCVGGYWHMVADGQSEIYSLRDPKGGPHATVELSKPLPAYTDEGNDVGEGQVVRQVQGKQDTRPVEKYEQMLKEWFNHLNEGGTKLYWSGEMGENLDGGENDIGNINELEVWWERVKANPAKLATGGGIQVSTRTGDYGLPQAYESSNKPYVRDWDQLFKDAAYILSDNYDYSGHYGEPSWGRNWHPDPADIGQAIYYLAWVDGQDLGKMVEQLDETIMDTQHQHEYNGYEWYRDQAQERLNEQHGEDEPDDETGEYSGKGANHEEETLNGDKDDYEEAMMEARQDILDSEFGQPYELSQYLYHLNDLHPGHRLVQHPEFQHGVHTIMQHAEGPPPESLPSLWGAKAEFQRLQESLAEERKKAINPQAPEAEQAMPGNDEHTTSRTLSVLEQGLHDLCHPISASSGLWAFQAASEGMWALSHPEHEPQTLSTRDLALRGIIIRVTDDGHALTSV